MQQRHQLHSSASDTVTVGPGLLIRKLDQFISQLTIISNGFLLSANCDPPCSFQLSPGEIDIMTI